MPSSPPNNVLGMTTTRPTHILLFKILFFFFFVQEETPSHDVLTGSPFAAEEQVQQLMCAWPNIILPVSAALSANSNKTSSPCFKNSGRASGTKHREHEGDSMGLNWRL